MIHLLDFLQNCDFFRKPYNNVEFIRDAIESIAGQCDIVRMEEADIQVLGGYDLIGLGCPTFAYAEPANVKAFIKTMGPLKGRQSFIFSTYGGHPGNVLPSMARKLRRQGLKVVGGFNCDGWDHMPHYTSPWYTEGHPDEVDLKAAAYFGREMAQRSRMINGGEKVSLPKFQWLKGFYEEGPKTTQVNRPLSRDFKIKMTVDTKECRYPKCRLCVDNCPVNAIDLSVSPVVFRKGCISCYFCEMLCPTGAIEADPASVKAHQQGTIEMLLQRKYPEFFEKAKTELIDNRSTLYRMLVDRVEIGNMLTMYEEFLDKRPRYIIRK